MKRGAPMRRTPLLPGAPLARRTPLVSRSVLSRGAGINPVSAKRQQQNRVRVVSERELGRQGLYGTCARCGDYTYVNGHERLRRSQGGDPARPDCLLCVPCNGWCADNPRLACWTGWSTSPKWPHDHTLANGEARDLNGCIVIFAAAEQLGEAS